LHVSTSFNGFEYLFLTHILAPTLVENLKDGQLQNHVLHETQLMKMFSFEVCADRIGQVEISSLADVTVSLLLLLL
jgi:hypothetical protein